MSSSQIPAAFDWVTARSKCSLEAVFIQLVEVVKSDTEIASALPRWAAAQFVVTRPADNKVVITRTKDAGGLLGTVGVVIEMLPNSIVVRAAARDASAHIVARPSLSADGACGL